MNTEMTPDDFPVTQERFMNTEMTPEGVKRYNIESGGVKRYENSETGDESFFYTVVNPDDPKKQDRLVFVQQCTPHGSGPVHFALPNSLIVDNQQLAELGWLLIALAGKDVDYSSAAELLEGYGMSVPDALEKLCSE